MNTYFKYLIVSFFLIVQIVASAQIDFTSIDNLIFRGELEQAKEKIDNSFLFDASEKEKIELYKAKGDIAQIKGDIDAAYGFWIKSNHLRSKLYQNKDYHLAWNYALLSNYHYEKINTALAISYADTCSSLIQNLSIEEQKEIEIYKIWNILAQSYKQKNKGMNIEQVNINYIITQKYYNQSITFIEEQNIELHHLGSTYRLMGNSYLDLLFHSETEKEYLHNYNQANSYYSKSKNVFLKLYGNEHFELARTYFVNGLLNFYSKDSIIAGHNQKAIRFFEKSIASYNIDKGINEIPNKEDFLMATSYLTQSYFRMHIASGNKSYLDSAQRINDVAVEEWNNINISFKSINTNKNLAIYGLMPFEQTIAIEVFKMKAKLKYSKEKIFQANQKLKYYDLIKVNNGNNVIDESIDIQILQNRLEINEVFLDFHTNNATQNVVITKISRDNSEIILIPTLAIKIINDFNTSINNFDFERYVKSAFLLYKEIIEPCRINDENLIICADGELNNVPFEALLCSEKNTGKKDYRKLDYLLFKNNIQYVLNPQFFGEDKGRTYKMSITAFAPNNSGYSELPFSEKMVRQLNDSYRATIFTGELATKGQFLQSSSSILHLSGHGQIDSENALYSQLVFSNSMLSIEDLSRLNNTPKLLVLNTCNSSLGKYLTGDGVDGFVRAFHAKGVPTTLSNSWEVDDKVSNELLFDFYELLQKGNSTIDALQTAQKHSIKNANTSKMASPYYWAGHRLVGEELVFVGNKKNTSTLWWWIGGGLLVIGGLVYWLRRKAIKGSFFEFKRT